jgi:hypothetical protein
MTDLRTPHDPALRISKVQRLRRRSTVFREPALLALQSLRAHKLRSSLTLLGVTLSVSVLIFVVSVIAGTNRYIADRVANLGSNVFLVIQFPIITNQEDFFKAARRNGSAHHRCPPGARRVYRGRTVFWDLSRTACRPTRSH